MSSAYFQTTSQTVFERLFLEEIQNNLSLSAVSFESRAEVYNETFSTIDKEKLDKLSLFARHKSENCWKLNEQRVEDGWFLFVLATFFHKNMDPEKIDMKTARGPSQRIDVESLCEIAWDHIETKVNPWIYHICKIIGCSQGI